MVPVVREHYWEVKLNSLWVGDTKFCCEPGTNNYVIFDSGTSFNTVPSNEVKRFRQLVPERNCNLAKDKEKGFPTLRYLLVRMHTYTAVMCVVDINVSIDGLFEKRDA